MKEHEVLLPNALIIGAQKAGTTWLASRLSQHPDVFIPRQEIHYFDNDKNFAKGVSWYNSFFNNTQNYKIRCEKTPDYLWTNCSKVHNEPKDKVKRLKSLLPNCKLLVILRDPVKRAISAWNHHVQAGRIHPSTSINKIFASDCQSVVNQLGILTRGLYSQQLTDYLEYFDRKQFLIIFFEQDIVGNPQETLKKTCSFLKINENHEFLDLNKPENRPQSTQIGVLLAHKSKEPLRQNILKLDRKVVCKLPVKKWKQDYPNTDTISDLRAYYQQDIEKLKVLLGSIPF